MTTQYIALIPAYNPTQVLCDLVRNLCNAGFSIVVVNDGSQDSCSGIFDSCTSRARVLHLPKNSGKGYALKTGLSYIYDNFSSDSIIVTIDADGQYAVEDALTICHQSKSHNRALVLGSRSIGRDVSLRSRFRNTLTAFLFHRNTGIRLRDPLSGLRAFPFRMIPSMLNVEGYRYEYEINVLLHCARSKKRILEFPVKTVYNDHYSLSHFKLVKEALQTPKAGAAQNYPL